nr:immunoglobulin light chain junction region [Macaca mulatta]
CLQDLQLPLAF